MSFLIYNNIGLNLLKTNSVERTVKHSDDGVEYVHTEFTISVTAVYSPAQGATSYGPGPTYEPGNLPMVTDAIIRHYLMQPRKSLLYQEGGIDILSVPVNLDDGGAIDAYNGPIPQSCSITRITGSRLFYVNYVVKCFIIECPTGSDCGDFSSVCCALVSSRYSRTEYIDEQYRSTMVTSGIAYFRSDVLSQFGTSPDAFRGMLIPPQLNGYKRKNIQFSLASNGSMIEFSCYDVENFIDLGSITSPGTAASVGITDMDLRYSAGPALGGSGNVKVVGYGALVNVTASAKGMKAANTLDMTVFLIAICVQKLGNIFGPPGVKGIGIPAGCKIVEDVFRKEVTVSMDYFVNPDEAVGRVAATNAPILGWIGDSNPGIGPNMINLPDLGGLNPTPPFSNGTRGTAAYQLAVSAFAQSCYCILSPADTDPTGTDFPPDLSTPANPYGDIPSIQALPPPELPATPYYRSRGLENFRSLGDTEQTAYLEYRVDDDYHTSTGIFQMPASGPLPSSPTPTPTPTPVPTPNSPAWYNTLSCINIRLFNPISTKKIRWSITRVGCVPEAPDPAPIESLDAYYTLIGRVVSPKPIELDASGGVPIYRLSGEYTYSLSQSVPNGSYLPFAIPPWVSLEPSPYTEMEPTDFIQGIINYPTTDQAE
jgi:hypothetical protein